MQPAAPEQRARQRWRAVQRHQCRHGALATAMTINLSRDVRSAIHGLEVWPYA
jgi:hypothetical protein